MATGKMLDKAVARLADQRTCKSRETVNVGDMQEKGRKAGSNTRLDVMKLSEPSRVIAGKSGGLARRYREVMRSEAGSDQAPGKRQKTSTSTVVSLLWYNIRATGVG